MDDKAFMQAIDTFQAAGIEKESVGDICITYKTIKPILSKVVDILKVFPVWGSAASEALSLLMTGLDTFCKIS
jgi:hypothetical protein